MRTQICKNCNFQFTEADKHWDEFQITNKCPKCQAQYISGKRFVVAFASWCFVGFGALSSLMFISAGFIGLLPLIAWVSLGVMTFYWLKNHKCHWGWIFFGTVAGTVSAVIFASMFLLYVWAMPLAIYLVFWHLQDNIKS